MLIVPVYLDAAIIMRAICRNTREKRSKARLHHSQVGQPGDIPRKNFNQYFGGKTTWKQCASRCFSFGKNDFQVSAGCSRKYCSYSFGAAYVLLQLPTLADQSRDYLMSAHAVSKSPNSFSLGMLLIACTQRAASGTGLGFDRLPFLQPPTTQICDKDMIHSLYKTPKHHFLSATSFSCVKAKLSCIKHGVWNAHQQRAGLTSKTYNAHAHLFSFNVQMKAEEQEEHEYIRSYTRRRWLSTWCTILRLNASACATDMREGLRRPHSLTAARSGPPPSSEVGGLSGEGSTPNELGVDGVDADNAATVVLADKLITVGAKARTWGGIATPGRRLPLNNGGIITANSFKRPGSTEAVPSGRGVMQQGENASTGQLASPIDASADHFAVFSRRYRGTVDRDSPNLAPSLIVPTNSVKDKYANSGREMIQRGQDSSWRLANTWTMPSASKLFGSNQRDNRGTKNDSPPTDSPVLLVSNCIGRTLQSPKNGTELADAIHVLESSSCDEVPSPRLAASFKIGGDSPEWGADDQGRVARSLCSGGPELANSGRFSVDQSSNQLLEHQDDGKLPQYQIKNPAPQRVLRSSNDPESSVPPTMMTEHNRARASRPNREKAGAPPDALLAADELVNARIKDDLLTRNNSLRQGVMLGSGTTSVCSSGKSQAPEHGLNCKASDVGTLDSSTVQASLQKGTDACASTRGVLVGMDRPLLPRGNRCPVEIDFPRRSDHQASQAVGSDSSRAKGGTKGGTNYSPVPKSTRCPMEVAFPRRLDREASLVNKGRVEGSTKGAMDAPALSRSITGGTDASVLPRGNRCSIEVDFPRRLNTIPFERLGSGAGSDGRTDSSRSHGLDDEILNGPRAALRGITAVFQNSADSSFPRRKSFSSAVWEPPADADDEESSSTMSESLVEPKNPEQDASLLYLNCINWRAWDDMATINASWKNTPFALDQPRRGSQRRPSREGSKGTAASSSWRSYRSTEHNTLIENKVSSGDGEAPAVKEQQGLHRDIRNQHSARASVSVLAKLVSHKRGGPVQSDIPRRRSSEISVRNGAAVVAMDDNCDDGKAPNIHQLKDEDGALSLAPAKEDSTSKFERGRGCPRLQGRAPASGGVELNGRGGECPGVQSRTSVAVSLDISDRSSGRPEIQGRTPVTTGLGGSSHQISGGNSAGMHGGQMVQCQRCQEDAAIAQDEAGLVDGVVRATIPAQQGSRRDPGTDGDEGGGGGGNAGREGVPVSPVELKPRSPEYADNKGLGVGLLTQYSDGFSDGGDELHGEEEGKVAAW